MNSVREALKKYPEHGRDMFIFKRTYQAELLASFIYRKILTNDNLLAHFETDDGIDQFWQQRDDHIRAIWGQTVDLEQTDRFNDSL